jgi:hypothetical protein
MVEAACEDFETLDRLVQGELKLVLNAEQNNAAATAWALEARARITVMKALGKSFVMHISKETTEEHLHQIHAHLRRGPCSA